MRCAATSGSTTAGSPRTEAAAPAVEKRLRARLGAAFAGAWIRPGDTRLTVAVIDASAGATVRTEGRSSPPPAGRAPPATSPGPAGPAR